MYLSVQWLKVLIYVLKDLAKGYWCHFPGLKRSGREADRSPQSIQCVDLYFYTLNMPLWRGA